MHKLLASFALLLTLLPGAAGAAGKAVVVAPFETDSLSQLVASQKGQPFVLIVWSLDCEFCQASLKTLAQEKRKGKKLKIVTLATDSLDDPQAAALVQQRLAALGMTRDAWAYGAAPAEQLRYAVDPKWHGEMPRSYWFDARGGRQARSGVLTPAIVAQLSSSL